MLTDIIYNDPEYAGLKVLIEASSAFLEEEWSDFFSSDGCHPVLALKERKIIHDRIWGTISLDWHELAILDTPLLQRLRDIQQTSCAHYVYPSLIHSRFEHTLGVVHVATRVFDAVVARGQLDGRVSPEMIPVLRRHLRLAALLHDTGHSAFSHTSEAAFSEVDAFAKAVDALHRLVGKKAGAAEVLSFCLALAPPLHEYETSPQHRLCRADSA